MKRMIATFLCGAALCAGALPVGAMAAEQNPRSDRTPRINVREREQRARIRQGLKSGELTRQEARRLKAEEKRIRAAEARAKSDGAVSAAERKRLDRKLDKANRDIFRQKHDDRDQN